MMKNLFGLILLLAALTFGESQENRTIDDSVYASIGTYSVWNFGSIKDTILDTIINVKQTGLCEVFWITVFADDTSSNDSVATSLHWASYDANGNLLAVDHTDSINISADSTVYSDYGMSPPPFAYNNRLVVLKRAGMSKSGPIKIRFKAGCFFLKRG